VTVACPKTDRPAWTGVRMSAAELQKLSELAAFNFRRPACRKMHTWSKASAWLQDD
jgi:hypothetical protein